MVEFLGMEPWFDSFPRIEFQTTDGFFDLYNDAELMAVNIQPQLSSVVLEFAYLGNPPIRPPIGLELRFGGVSGLVIRQAADYDPRAATVLQGLIHDYRDGRSEFTVDAGDLTCTFVAASVALGKAGPDK